MKSFLVIFTCLCAAIIQSFATPQTPDELSLGSEKIQVHGFTVNDLIGKQMMAMEAKHGSGYSHMSTANLRGFVAALELKDGKLFVRKVEIKVYSEEREKAFEELSKMTSRDPKKVDVIRMKALQDIIQHAGIIDIPLSSLEDFGHADWFSGELYHYFGPPLSYGYTHKLSKARVFTFSRGKLVSDKIVTVKE